MYYADLKNNVLLLAWGKNDDDAVNKCIEKYGSTLLGVYKDNGNDPFIPLWKNEEPNMRVREYTCVSNGYHEFWGPFFVASEFENPIIQGQDNWLSVWFCVCSWKDIPSTERAVEILSERRNTGHRSFKKVKVSADILAIKGAVESLVRAIVVNQCEKHPDLLPETNRKPSRLYR
jgi:hypothetical protein